MHIKEIAIQGFKSYKEARASDISPRHSVVVGQNGAGKSNFFQAIEFVLGDTNSSLSASERNTLLHEGTGLQVMSAFVEIKFDNSDGRFPNDKDEVTIRRHIGMKKDEYFLDKKHITKTEITNLLESAGFSRANPYYIVKQGKVQEMTMMHDNQRLDLLMEVAGTKVYDESRAKSTKMMEESDVKRRNIDEVLEYIEQRLRELESEKEELKEYQKLDRTRRSLEYTIHDKELASIREQLDEIEIKRQKESERVAAAHAGATTSKDQVRELEAELKDLSGSVAEMRKEKEAADEDRSEAIKSRAKLELEVKDLEEGLSNENSEKTRIDGELTKLHKKIDKTQKELETVTPKFEEARAREADLKKNLADKELVVSSFFARQGRSAQFKSKKERDDWINKEIKALREATKDKKKQVKDLETDIKKLGETIEREATELKDKDDNLSKRKKAIEENAVDVAELKRTRDELTNNRKELWRKDAEMTKRSEEATAKVSKATRDLTHSMTKQTSAGLQALREIAERHGIRGVYGPVIELFSCDAKFHTAVEVTAGNSLFNVVVDNDITASKLIDALLKEKGGRLTFMPLNRLDGSPKDMPVSDDVIPMISKLQFEPEVRAAMQHIFGKVLVCRNLEVASAMSKSANLDCVTLDGDQVNRKGAITGGFIDSKHLRLAAMTEVRKAREELDSMKDEMEKVKAAVAEVDQHHTKCLGEIQKLESKDKQTKATYEQLRLDVKRLQQNDTTNRQQLEDKEKTLEELRIQSKTLEDQAAVLQEELGTELLSKASESDRRTLATATADVQTLQKELLAASEERTTLEGERSKLTSLLNTNLVKRERELADLLESLTLEQNATKLESKKSDLETVNKTLSDLTKKQKEFETEISATSKREEELKAQLEELRNTDSEHTRLLTNEGKAMERLINKRAGLLQRKEEVMRQIRELGSLPGEAFEKYADLTPHALTQQLHKTKEKLGKYSHVNKKALDQYVSFSEQRDTLRNRKKDLDTGGKAIRELIETLDRRKDEAIERTFKGVAKAFSEVFTELVPGGKASLVMLRREAGDDAEEEPSEAPGLTEKYSGIGLRVSFTGHGEAYSLQQLSGGQKTVVALSLIFAIQRTDPAPFYLFDEIDSALDAQYRTTVANLIHRQAEKAQFITTTFRPEFLQDADKFYAVELNKKAKTSHIREVDRGDAEAFVSNVDDGAA